MQTDIAVLQRARRARLLPAAASTARSPAGCIAITATARFADVTIAAGLGAADSAPRSALSAADFNGDGWLDLFVANDEQENQLWINQRNGTFTNTALAAGVALGPNGERKANMGVDAGDFDNDGDEDLFVTELINQGSSLYVNDGAGRVRGAERAPRRCGDRACLTPASARPGSTSTTTAGWICWPSTAT